MDVVSLIYSFIERKIFPFKPSRRPDAIPGCSRRGHHYNIKGNITKCQQNISNFYSSDAVMEDILCTLPLLYELDNFSSEIMEDRLSLLPDDILVSILSKLTLREAVLTSSLSSRWRYLWMHVVCLNSNISEFTNKAWKDLLLARRRRFKFMDFCKKEGLRHINLINHALNLHRGHTLEEFSVSSPYEDSFKSKVDNWLKFVSSKKVQHLKLVLTDHSWLDTNIYSIPVELLSHGSDACFGFKALKCLTVDRVDVCSQVAKTFLSNCPLLEQLSIRNSPELEHLEIGPSLKLKHLEIYQCNIDYLEICSANLVSFSYTGLHDTNLHLKDVSSVVNLRLQVQLGSLSRLVDIITTKFTQVGKLSLRIYSSRLKDIGFDHHFPKLKNLKWLILKVICVDFSLLHLTPLLQASPYLEMLDIKIKCNDGRIKNERCNQSLTSQSPYQLLKVVRYGGYYGGLADEELIAYLLEKSLALEKFIVTPCHPYSPNSRKKSCKLERRARSRAWRQLEGKVPKGVELVIL